MSKTCERCGREMPDGGLAYEVRIEVYADFDGTLAPPEAECKVEDELRALVARTAERDAEALMRDVHHSERHLLCRPCRDRYLANPLNLPLPESGLP